jgi:tetratricopeptide (TPR) repeat protein
MPPFEPLNLPVPAGAARSREAYRHALSLLHAFRGDPRAVIETALADDAEFIAGHCFLAGLHVMDGSMRSDAPLARSLKAIESSWDRADPRERRHAAAARAWASRDVDRAARLYCALVVDYPHDTLALQVAQSFDFQLGQREMLRDRVGQVLPFWNRTMPGYGFVLTLHAFGLEENGAYRQAEAAAREALACDPANAGATRVVAHVLEMQGRAAAGIDWLHRTRAVWAEGSAFDVHNAWHLALFHLALDQTGAALAVHDRHIAAADPARVSALIDASALLWRLHLRGVALDARWTILAERWARVIGDQRRLFNLFHALIAFAAAGRHDEVDHVLAKLRMREGVDCRSRDDWELGLRLCEAFRDFAAGRYRAAFERLANVRHLAERCGGSIAQCDLVHLTLVEAALRSASTWLPRALYLRAKPRLRRSPSAFGAATFPSSRGSSIGFPATIRTGTTPAQIGSA